LIITERIVDITMLPIKAGGARNILNFDLYKGDEKIYPMQRLRTSFNLAFGFPT